MNPVAHNPARRRRYHRVLGTEVAGSVLVGMAAVLIVPIAFFETNHQIGQPDSSAVLILIALFGVLFSLVADPHFRRAARWWWLDLSPFHKKYLCGWAAGFAATGAAASAGCQSPWIGCSIGLVGVAIGYAITAIALRVIANRRGVRQ